MQRRLGVGLCDAALCEQPLADLDVGVLELLVLPAARGRREGGSK